MNRALSKRKNTSKAYEKSVYLGTDFPFFDSLVRCKKKSISKPPGEFWLTYVGTLGHSYDLKPVIQAVTFLQSQYNLKFIVLGDGPLKQCFEEYAISLQSNVLFLGRKSYEEMVHYLKISDIAINPITKGAASIINKHADYAAAGKPVVSTQDSCEYKKLLENYHAGINCSNDPAEMAKTLEKILNDEVMRKNLGENSRRLGEEKFNRKVTYKEIYDMINEILEEGKKCDIGDKKIDEKNL